MKSSALVLLGIAVGCAAGVVGLAPSIGVSRAATPIAQYCTDTGDYNNSRAVDAVVRKAGEQGWELVGVYRPANIGYSHVDYVCFRQPR
jgi:hypothetical protein